MKRWALDLPYHLKQARKWTKHLKQQSSGQGPATKNDDPLEMGNKRDEPYNCLSIWPGASRHQMRR